MITHLVNNASKCPTIPELFILLRFLHTAAQQLGQVGQERRVGCAQLHHAAGYRRRSEADQKGQQETQAISEIWYRRHELE